MITPTLRVYLTDFVGTDKEDEVIDRISEYGNEVNNMTLYFHQVFTTQRYLTI